VHLSWGVSEETKQRQRHDNFEIETSQNQSKDKTEITTEACDRDLPIVVCV
jgi:hypothetical protein